jgi:hypothetical protein
MQTITTKYLGATESRGSRIKATTTMGESVTVPYDHSKSNEAVHRVAFLALMEKLPNWGRNAWTVGDTKTGYIYVIAQDIFSVAEAVVQE